MSLIKCNECEKDVSNNAPTCPNCGNPIAQKIITIEKTSKEWKAIKLISWLLFFGGAFMFFSNYASGGFSNYFTGLGFSIGFLGVIGIFIAKFGSWWTNK